MNFIKISDSKRTIFTVGFEKDYKLGGYDANVKYTTDWEPFENK